MNEYSIRDIYSTLRRHIALVVGFPLLFGIVATIVLLILPRTFSASATVRVSNLTVGEAGSQRTNLMPIEVENLALSQGVLALVVGGVNKVHLADFKLVTTVGPNALIVALTAKSTNPTRAAEVANAWAKATVDATNGVSATLQRQQIAALENANQQAQATSQAVQNELRTFTATTTLAIDQSMVQANLRELGRLGPSLAAAQEDAAVAAAGVDTGTTLAEAKVRVAAVNARIATLSGSTKAAQERIAAALPRHQQLQADLTAALGTISQAQDSIYKLRMQVVSGSGAAGIFVPASPPESANGAGNGLKVVIAVLVGLLLGCTIPFFMEALRSPSEDDQSLSPPLHGKAGGASAH